MSPVMTPIMWGDPAPRHQVAAGILLGALLLAWPALWNLYPIVFSDTHAFLVQAGAPQMVWDKPFTYGPFLRLLHQNTTLWLPLAAQVLILSHLLWLVQTAMRRGRPLYHVALCAGLAAGSAAPFFASLLMPDLFAPITVLGLFLLGRGLAMGGWARLWVGLLTTCAIAFHLSHLVLAAACIAALALLRRGWRPAVPLAAALAVLVLTNIVGYGRVAVSPFGAVFALARLVADGPAATEINQACPSIGWRLCAWAGRLPTDSDSFLWDGTGPVWSTPGGARAVAPEASAIVAQTIRHQPGAVLQAALANTLRQAGLVGLGDTIRADWLDGSITGSLRAYFPAAELARFQGGLQAQNRLAWLADLLNPPDAVLLVLGALGCIWLALRQHDSNLRVLACVVLVAVLANAAATGALSGPHPRYQARIAWLVLLPPALIRRRTPHGPDSA